MKIPRVSAKHCAFYGVKLYVCIFLVRVDTEIPQISIRFQSHSKKIPIFLWYWQSLLVQWGTFCTCLLRAPFVTLPLCNREIPQCNSYDTGNWWECQAAPAKWFLTRVPEEHSTHLQCIYGSAYSWFLLLVVSFNEGYEKLSSFIDSSKLNRPNKRTVCSLNTIIPVTGWEIHISTQNGICYEFPATRNMLRAKQCQKQETRESHPVTEGTFMALKWAALFMQQ